MIVLELYHQSNYYINFINFKHQITKIFPILLKRKFCFALYAHNGIISLFWVQTGLLIISELSEVSWVVLYSVLDCLFSSFLYYYSCQVYYFLKGLSNLYPPDQSAHIKRCPQIQTFMKMLQCDSF